METSVTPRKNNTHIIIIGVFTAIAILFGITGIIIAETKPEPKYKETLVTSNNSLMTLKSGSNLLYTYSLDETPAARKSKYSGYFNVTIEAPTGVPNVKFSVKDDTGDIISDGETIIAAPVTKVPFVGVRSSRFIYLHVDVQTGNQNLKNMSVHIN